MFNKLSFSTLSVVSILILFLFNCNDNNLSIEKIYPIEKNLMEYGIPITIRTPHNVKTTDKSDNFMQDIVIEADRFYIQIYSQTSTSMDCKILKMESLSENKQNSTFKQLLQEEDCGYIYSVQSEGDTLSCYNFEYFVVRGNKSYKFSTTTAYRNPFSLKEVEQIFASVKNIQ